jgi:tetratricopeptide (TPR) repeat protein
MSPADQHHLLAAQGWLELGDWLSANEELENVQPQLRAHPDILKMRVEVYSAAKKWDYVIEVAGTLARLVPDQAFGYVRLAYALHALTRTQEAWNALLPVADKFPSEWVIPYNLACYAAQLGDLIAARDWLAQAFNLADDPKRAKLAALEDPDLVPLWAEEQAT